MPPVARQAAIRHHVTRATAFARREMLAVSAMLGLALLAGAFLEIADDVAEGETDAFDRSVLLALRTHAAPHDPIGPDWVTTAMADVTALGSIAVLTLVVSLIVGLFASLRHFRQAGAMLAASVGGLIWSETLKGIFLRDRPEEMYRIVEAHNASFPSGHTMLSAAIYLTLGAFAASFARKRRIRALCLSAAIIATLLVGSSRVFLGVHWASDVLAGWCLGAAWALFCWLALWVLDGRWRNVRPLQEAPIDAPAPGEA
jgi:undecaprenyl-diphosphatase